MQESLVMGAVVAFVVGWWLQNLYLCMLMYGFTFLVVVLVRFPPPTIIHTLRRILTHKVAPLTHPGDSAAVAVLQQVPCAMAAPHSTVRLLLQYSHGFQHQTHKTVTHIINIISDQRYCCNTYFARLLQRVICQRSGRSMSAGRG